MSLPQSMDTPEPASAHPVPARTHPVPARAYPVPARARSPRPKVAPVLWALLGVAVLFMAAVQIALRPAAPPREADGDTASLWSQSPSEIRSPETLRLDWQPAEGAFEYRLRITSALGLIVVDELRVAETSWVPPREILPALQAGEYIWQVEAVGDDGETLARSAPMTVRIGM